MMNACNLKSENKITCTSILVIPWLRYVIASFTWKENSDAWKSHCFRLKMKCEACDGCVRWGIWLTVSLCLSFALSAILSWLSLKRKRWRKKGGLNGRMVLEKKKRKSIITLPMAETVPVLCVNYWKVDDYTNLSSLHLDQEALH